MLKLTIKGKCPLSVFEKHYSKYLMFKKDAQNEDNSVPVRIDSFFYASFHLIESIAAKHGVHIERHQKVRVVLENNESILKDKTEKVWRAFLKIENQIRPGQVYGGVINGKRLEKTKELFGIIENTCLELLE